MKRNVLNISPALLIPAITSLVAQPAYAQSVAPTGGGGITGLHLPELGGLLVDIIDDLLVLSGVVVVILIIVAGIRYVLATGDPKAAAAARGALTYAIFGLIVIMLAVTFVDVAGNFLGVSNLDIVKIPFR